MAIATDSATELRKIIGDDSTATFEDDPTFVDSNPGADGSSDNVEEQRDTDDLEDSDEEIEEEENDDDEDEDDVDEVAAATTLRADGLLGYEDEEQDVEKHEDRKQGDEDRAKAESKLKEPKPDILKPGYGHARHKRPTDTDGDDDAGDVDRGIDEDALNADDMDTDQVAAAAFAASRSFARPQLCA